MSLWPARGIDFRMPRDISRVLKDSEACVHDNNGDSTNFKICRGCTYGPCPSQAESSANKLSELNSRKLINTILSNQGRRCAHDARAPPLEFGISVSSKIRCRDSHVQFVPSLKMYRA